MTSEQALYFIKGILHDKTNPEEVWVLPGDTARVILDVIDEALTSKPVDVPNPWPYINPPYFTGGGTVPNDLNRIYPYCGGFADNTFHDGNKSNGMCWIDGNAVAEAINNYQEKGYGH